MSARRAWDAWHPWHPWPARTFGETGAVLLALTAATGAWLSREVPIGAAIVALAVSLALRRPWLVVVAVGLLASALGAQAMRGAAPATPGTITTVVTLMTDPVAERGGMRAEVRDGTGRRLELHGTGAPARLLHSRLAGERLAVSGALKARRPGDMWLLRRHVVGSIQARSIDRVDDGNVAARAANSFRRTLLQGAASLPADEQALYTGFVFGDDRAERPEVIEDFRASGLSHLLAVSGENVAFVLVAAQPILSRLGVRGRLVLALGLLAFFAFATRLEPSVLRATAMAMIAVLATTLGRPVSALRTLALAVTALLLLDPFLVGVVGFQLSAAASAGIILFARPLAARLPGPRVAAELLGVTLAAQIGVAPILLTTFGSVPLVSLPANMLAVPAAGPVMVWGLTGGVVAGVVGGPIAAAIHVPTHLLLWWVASVARVAATLPLGDLHAGHTVVATLAALVLLAVSRSATVAAVLRGARRSMLALATALALVSLVVWVRPVAQGPETVLARGAVLHNGWAGGSVLVVDGSADLGDVLAGLRRNGVRELDVLVVRSRGWTIDSTVSALLGRVPARLVLAPSTKGAGPDGGLAASTAGERVTPRVGDVIDLGDLVVEIEEATARLRVTVHAAGEPGTAAQDHGVGSARGPP